MIVLQTYRNWWYWRHVPATTCRSKRCTLRSANPAGTTKRTCTANWSNSLCFTPYRSSLSRSLTTKSSAYCGVQPAWPSLIIRPIIDPTPTPALTPLKTDQMTRLAPAVPISAQILQVSLLFLLKLFLLLFFFLITQQSVFLNNEYKTINRPY